MASLFTKICKNRRSKSQSRTERKQEQEQQKDPITTTFGHGTTQFVDAIGGNYLRSVSMGF